MTNTMPSIPLTPLLVPEDPELAVTALQRAVEAAHRGDRAVAPITDPAQARSLPETVAAGTAALLSTSGSSGVPKRTLLSRSALLASARATSERLGGPGDWLLCLPAGFVAGFQVISRAVLGGTRVSALREGRFDPAGFAAAARALPAGRRYTSLVPTQIARLLADAESRDALAGFDRVLIGGARLDEATDRRLRAVTAAVITYGMTETCGGCVYDGVPLRGVRVRIVDELIHIGGDVVADGYLDPPADQPFYTEDGTRWYRTADRGLLSADVLVPTGRIDDLINTGGVKVSAIAIEQALSEFSDIQAAVVMGVPDPEWGELVGAYVVPRQGVPMPDPELLRDRVRQRLGRAAVPKRFVLGTEVPLLPNSKIDRRAVHQRLTTGTEPAHA
ncbi:o-succinylbenzoate--CoA ligase [Nocardia seriolae]|uniref:O-succinylbenzoate--CoA ligase n=1 Tax=Nocardia seriolae TaxID=37332 RepID=A0ABC8AZF4_9NOCA|nr:AMP-binding protein [Nocardia seriolae]APA99455.1 o-succinylbenzoate--CoA ligase [Nocardia seriolae]